MFTRALSNGRLKISILLPYPNPHVLDWVRKMNDNIQLNIGCVNSTQGYRPGYFSEYDEIPGVHYFFKGKQAKEIFHKNLKESEVLISLGVFEKQLLEARMYCHKNIRLIVLSEPFNPINSGQKDILRNIWSSLIRMAYRRIDFLCIGGNEVKSYYKKLGFKNSRFFQFGYFPDIEFTSPRIHSIREGNFEEIIITFIGQLIPRKGIDRLLKLIDYLSQTTSKYKLYIAGGGILEPQLTKKIEELDNPNVFYLGLISDKGAIQNLLKDTDILFIPSYFDGWGAVVNEAVSQSCAIISSDKVYSSKVLVVNNVNGFIFSDNFEECFDVYLNNYVLLNDHKKACKDIYDKWNSENVAIEVVKLLNGEVSNLLVEL